MTALQLQYHYLHSRSNAVSIVLNKSVHPTCPNHVAQQVHFLHRQESAMSTADAIATHTQMYAPTMHHCGSLAMYSHNVQPGCVKGLLLVQQQARRVVAARCHTCPQGTMCCPPQVEPTGTCSPLLLCCLLAHPHCCLLLPLGGPTTVLHPPMLAECCGIHSSSNLLTSNPSNRLPSDAAPLLFLHSNH